MISALLLCLSLSASPVTVELHLMPPGTMLTLPTGEKVRYFTFEEYKTLLGMDNDLWALGQQISTYKELESKYVELVSQKDIIISTMKSDKDILTAQLKRAEENWHAAEQRAIDNAGGPMWPYMLAGGGAALGLAGTILYLVSLSH